MDDTLSSSCCAPFAGRPGPDLAFSSAARAASDSTVLFRASSICKAHHDSYITTALKILKAAVLH